MSSIAGGAWSVITAVFSATTPIYKFIRDCREARADLSKIDKELFELRGLLKLIYDDNAAATRYYSPNALQAHVQAMLASCTTAVQQIEHTLNKCRGKSGPVRWTWREWEKVVAWKSALEAFKSGLNLALVTINRSTMREMDNKIDVVQADSAETKGYIIQLLH
ncbi:hypothetical protein GGS24DRAFT_406572 [Hypoxylon argillaceum]|nr:hypothetical protein GGS24DRAFT_406572 [Hypoxylon argillaceum]